MNPDQSDTCGNPFRPGTLAVRDPAHDAQLLRELATINARTVATLGPLPPGGLPVQPRRKPNLSYQPFSAADKTDPIYEDDPMKRHLLAAAALLPLVTAGCARTVDAGSAKATLNPHPVKRYEVIATSQAPGPWDSIEGTVFFDVADKKCVPQDWFSGAQDSPKTSLDIELVRVGEGEGEGKWKGYFYRDALRDDNYFDLGVCHWDATGVDILAVAQGVRFNWGGWLAFILREGTRTTYFKKSFYRNQSFVRWGTLDTDSTDPDVLKYPDNYFPVSITVREANL